MSQGQVSGQGLRGIEVQHRQLPGVQAVESPVNEPSETASPLPCSTAAAAGWRAASGAPLMTTR